MASSGVLGSFLSAMTEIRSQRLKEELAKQEADSQMWASIGSGISSLGKSVGGAIQQSGMDKMADTLMNQANPPVAGGTLPDGRVQAPGIPSTGGVDELKLRQSMGQFNKTSGDRLIQDEKMKMMRGRYDMARQANNRAAQAAREASAQKAFNAMSQSDKDYYNTAQAYQKDAPVLFEKINKAQTEDEYRAYAGQLRSLNSLATKRGLDLEQIQVPAFVSPQDRVLLSELEAAEKAAAAAPKTTGWFDSGQSPEAATLSSAQEAISGRHSPMSIRPQTPTMAGSNPANSNNVSMPAMGKHKVGDILVDQATGRRYRWDGMKPVLIQ